MIHAKNYETVSKFVKVMTKIRWPLFFRTRCKYDTHDGSTADHYINSMLHFLAAVSGFLVVG